MKKLALFSCIISFSFTAMAQYSGPTRFGHATPICSDNKKDILFLMLIKVNFSSHCGVGAPSKKTTAGQFMDFYQFSFYLLQLDSNLNILRQTEWKSLGFRSTSFQIPDSIISVHENLAMLAEHYLKDSLKRCSSALDYFQLTNKKSMCDTTTSGRSATPIVRFDSTKNVYAWTLDIPFKAFTGIGWGKHLSPPYGNVRQYQNSSGSKLVTWIAYTDGITEEDSICRENAFQRQNVNVNIWRIN